MLLSGIWPVAEIQVANIEMPQLDIADRMTSNRLSQITDRDGIHRAPYPAMMLQNQYVFQIRTFTKFLALICDMVVNDMVVNII